MTVTQTWLLEDLYHLTIKPMNGQSPNQLAKDPAGAASQFDQLGGEAALKSIINEFIDRVFQDLMIGFFFRDADRARVKEMEYQLAAHFLGAPIQYQGRPLDQVHAKLPIMGGHFARRRQILKDTLESFHVPEAIQSAWLAHTDALRTLITNRTGSGCEPIAPR